MPQALLDSLKKRPLFYAALVVVLVLAAFQLSHKPTDTTLNLPEAVVLEGQMVSGLEQEKSVFGQARYSFLFLSPSFSQKIKVYVSAPEAKPAYGDRLRLEGRLTRPLGRRNPGGFDARAYLERQGIGWSFFVQKNKGLKIIESGQGFWLKKRLIALKDGLSTSLYRAFPKQDAAFLDALILGRRKGLDEGLNDLFFKTGTLHILSVSGFNIGFLVFAVLGVLKILRLPIFIRLWMALAAVWFYCALVGAQAPVLRASIMATALLFGHLIGRKTDFLNTLGLAALLVLAWNPRQVLDMGFQLSFISVLALAVCVPQFIALPKLLPGERFTFWEKTRHYVQELFWVSFVCQVATLPWTIQNFYIVTPVSLLANLVVVPATFLLFIVGLVFFALPFLAGACQVMMAVLIVVLKAIESLPGAYFTCGQLHAGLVWILAAGLVYLFWWPRLAKAWQRAGIIVFFIAAVLGAQTTLRHLDRSLKLTMIDVGQGDSFFFEFPDGKNLLIDGGNGYPTDQGRVSLAPFLRSKGINRLDLVVATHPQADHIGGLETVFKEFEVSAFLDPGAQYPSGMAKRLQTAVKDEKSERLVACAGDEINRFQNTRIRIFNPPCGAEPDKNVNNQSVVLRIDARPASFLMTGDIEEPAMQGMLLRKADLDVEVLKVPHHGAKLKASGQAFVQATSPKLSLISNGQRNRYGHPNPETIAFLEAQPDNQILRTDQRGAVELRWQTGA